MLLGNTIARFIGAALFLAVFAFVLTLESERLKVVADQWVEFAILLVKDGIFTLRAAVWTFFCVLATDALLAEDCLAGLVALYRLLNHMLADSAPEVCQPLSLCLILRDHLLKRQSVRRTPMVLDVCLWQLEFL